VTCIAICPWLAPPTRTTTSPAGAIGARATHASAVICTHKSERSRPVKILVVNDDPNLCDVLALACQRAGSSVATAANGLQAVTPALRETPDLIVLDIGPPEMDRLAFCRQIRARSRVPILFRSARCD